MASSVKVLHPTQETLDDPKFFVISLFNGTKLSDCHFTQTEPHSWGDLTLHGYTSGHVFLQDSTGLVLAWELSSGRVNLADHDSLILFDADMAVNSPYTRYWTRPSMDDWCEVDLGDVVDAHRVTHLSAKTIDMVKSLLSSALSDNGEEGVFSFKVEDTSVQAHFAENSFRFYGKDDNGVKYRISADTCFGTLWDYDTLDTD